MRVLLTSPAGAPDNPRTWSGTPLRITESLRADGRIETVAWSSRHEDPAAERARKLDRALGFKTFVPGPARRYLTASRTRQAAKREGCEAVLHMGANDVGWSDSGLPEYLYIDNTYDLWATQAIAAQGVSAHEGRWQRRMERRALNQLRHIFTIGRHVADNLEQVYGIARERMSVIGAGLGGIQPHHGSKDYAKARLLIVAKVRPEDKGLPLLLAALPLLRKQRPDAELVVIGGGEYPEVKATEGARGTTWIEFEELQRLYNESTLFVMPATYEPWGLSYLEALACRTPIVGLARNAFPEISGDGRYGFTLQQNMPEALAALLLEALSDPARLERMGREGQEYCLPRFRWDRIGQQMADVIAATRN